MVARAKTAKEAMDSLTRQMTAVIQAVEKTGIEKKDIRTEQFGLNLSFDWSSGEQRLRGYDATQTLRVKVRDLAKTSEVPLSLSAGATLSDVFGALAEKLPMLVGRVITSDRGDLLNGYVANLNGCEFACGALATVKPGDSIIILSADAGG
mgnify:CR=1 FL=1